MTRLPTRELAGDLFDKDGERLGSLQDLVVDLHTGSIAYAVVGFGGRFGFGHRRIAVPWTRLTVEAARLVLDATPDQLRAARPLDGREWPRWPDPVFQPRKWTV